MSDDFAPSEEYTLLCDVPDCEASVAMVSGVDRSEHRWGRISVYTNGLTFPDDYDLCPTHFSAIKDVLH